MKKKLIIILFIICFINPIHAGFRNLKIGLLWHSVQDGGGMGWYDSNHLAGRYAFIWPAPKNISAPFLERRWPVPSLASASGFEMTVPNWVDLNGETIPIARAAGGDWLETVNLFSRVEPPIVIVDDVVISDPWPAGEGDLVDGSLPSDQMTHLRVRTALGVDVTQEVYAYTNRHFWNLLIYDYTFTNTGKLDINDVNVIPDQVLDQFYTHFYFRGAISREGHNAIENWGEWQIHEFMEYDENLKTMFAWDGDSWVFGVEDAGDPDPITGAWLSPQYFGMVSLHADIDAQNETNNENQPLGATWNGFSKTSELNDMDNTANQEYWLANYCSDFVRAPSWQGSGGNPTWEGGNPNWHGENQMRAYINYGPYNLQTDEDVRMAFAYIAGGLSSEKAAQYGAEYKAAVDAGNPGSFSWFDEVAGPPPLRGLEAKHALLNTGRDSLFNQAKLAKYLYDNDFICPSPPVSPSLTVSSSGGKIVVEWGDEPENEPDAVTGGFDFAGYRVYRSIGQYDTTLSGWEMVYEGTDHIFEDTGVPRGVATYYYVTAFDDGSQTIYGANDLGLVDGESLESSPFWNMTNVPAFRLKEPESNLSMVDVVPNPFNISAEPFQYPSEPNKILFVNLTPYATITIYTVSGDKVVTLDHTSGSAEEPWFQITKSNQYITSGVYIYHIVGRNADGSSTGEQTTGKFIVIR